MLRFLIRRLLYAVLVLVVISFVVFVIFFVLNGGTPQEQAGRFCGKGCGPLQLQATVARLHLDRPWPQQYGTYLWHLVQGDLGVDFSNNVSVLSEITARLPVSISVAIGAAVIWLIIGIPTGILAATKPRSFRDRAATVFALTFYSIPTFVLGLLMLLVFYYLLTIKANIRWFYGGGYTPITENPLTWAHKLILPWFDLALVYAAAYARITRGSMLDVLGEDYIRTARAKGLSERKVVYKHGLRSALTPVVTILGVDLGILLAGTVITEKIFTLPGVGAFTLEAITSGNLPVIAAVTLLLAVFVVLANLTVDILYAVLDPRVRLS